MTPLTGETKRVQEVTHGTFGADYLLTLAEVIKILKMGRATVQRWCRDGRLPAAKIGKEYRIRRGDLEQWYEQMLAATDVKARSA